MCMTPRPYFTMRCPSPILHASNASNACYISFTASTTIA